LNKKQENIHCLYGLDGLKLKLDQTK